MAEMQSFQFQPLEIEDFSGGLTDNYFDSGPTRYQTADNFLVTVDRKLALRDGSVVYDLVNYLLPGVTRRVDALFTYLNETRLLVNQGRDILSLPEVTNPVWTSILGPSGNEAIGAGSSYSVVTSGEFQRQIYFATDAEAIPSRIYHDTSNNYVVRTAGLPRVQNPNTYNDTSLLAKCISNANALRASMIAHFSDVDGATGGQTIPSSTNLHWALDKWSLSYLIPEVFVGGDPDFPGPIPAPVPAPDATNQASLFNLVVALNAAFLHHNFGSVNFYHFIEQLPMGGSPISGAPFASHAPIAKASNPLLTTSLQTAAAQLDDLYQKWYWHQLAVNLHGNGLLNTYALMNKYIVGNSKIELTGYDAVNNTYSKQAPFILPDYQDFYNYVNGLVAVHNCHVGGGGGVQLYTLVPINTSGSVQHSEPGRINEVTLPTVNSLDSAYLAIAWLRLLYSQQHLVDSENGIGTLGITFDTTIGTPNLTNVHHYPGAVNATLTAGEWVVIIPPFTAPTFVGGPGFQNIAKVTVGGTGTATIDRNALASASIPFAEKTNMLYHFNLLTGFPVDGAPVIPTAQKLTTAFNALGSDLTTWLALATEYMYCIFNHYNDAVSHYFAAFTAANGFNPVQTPTVPQWFIPTVSTIAYAFTYYYGYTVDPGGVFFENESNPVFSASIETIEPYYPGYTVVPPVAAQPFIGSTVIGFSNPIFVYNIPALTNDASTNYDTANIKVRIYRTTDGGTAYFLDGTISNGVLNFNDNTNGSLASPGQALLSDNLGLYTNGGVVGNDQPPVSKYIHILNGVAYYGGVFDTGQFFPNRYRQSLPNNPDSAPSTFFDDLEDEIVGINSSRNNVIVFCKNSIYRISGGFNSLGQGQLNHERISDTVGCVGAHSIVRTEIGCFFGGNDGFYYTDGFQLVPISLDLKKTYQGATSNDHQKKRLTGAYDKLTRRIWWAYQSNPSDTECDRCFVYDLNYGVKPSGVFTICHNDGTLTPSLSNPLNYQYWRPGALIFFQGNLVRGDERGLLFKSDANSKTDPKIDLTLNAVLWNTVAIPWAYTSTTMDFGTHAKRKWVNKINVTGKNVGNASVLITSNSDSGRVIAPLAPINYTPNFVWGNPTLIWGASACAWTFDGKLDQWRRFPATTLRANLRSVTFSPARLGIYRSEDYPNGASASSNGVTKIVTIATPPGFTAIVWPIEAPDYYIAFQIDGYTQEFLITAVNGNQLTVSDPLATLGTWANQGWVLRGYRKNAGFELSAYVISFATLGDKNTAYTSKASSGENT